MPLPHKSRRRTHCPLVRKCSDAVLVSFVFSSPFSHVPIRIYENNSLLSHLLYGVGVCTFRPKLLIPFPLSKGNQIVAEGSLQFVIWRLHPIFRLLPFLHLIASSQGKQNNNGVTNNFTILLLLLYYIYDPPYLLVTVFKNTLWHRLFTVFLFVCVPLVDW